MILKPCPFCRKEIPRSITVCPYCHRDERGQAVEMDTSVVEISVSDKQFQIELKELASDDPYIRDQAVSRMAQRGTGVVTPLMNVLQDVGKPNLGGVARTLGKLGDIRAIPVLAQAAKLGDEDLRLAAVKAIAQFNHPEALPVLLTEAERPHPIIQSFLANVLGRYHDGRVVSVLSRLAVHPNREVAFQAACSLAETGGKESILALKAAWRKGDNLVRVASASSLRRLGSRPTRVPKSVWVWGSVGLVVVVLVASFFIFYK